MDEQLGLFDKTFYEQSEQMIFKRKSSIEQCIPFLEKNELMDTARSLRIRNGKEFIEADDLLVGVSIERSAKKSKAEIDLILKQYNEISSEHTINNEQLDQVWNILNYPKEINIFDKNRLFPDALAFYRPFHFSSFDEWGIYLLVDKLLDYYENVKKSLGKRSIIFQSDILLGYIVFEVFHHEFFHHIVESAATSLEVISSAFGKPQRFYINYFKQDYQRNAGLGTHQHDPLEEALANSYSYNSFSFASRINKGYKTRLVKAYQYGLLKGWKYDPPGYCNAGHYVNSGYIRGATQILGMILNSSSIDSMASTIVAKNVLLNGHSALCTKPDIPTYLVGSESSIKYFYKLIPVPNETYTNLFWHEEFSGLEKYINEKEASEKKKRTK